MNAGNRKILVLGASGLIGRFVTDDLRARGFSVVGVARRLSASQKSSPLDLELPVMSMEAAQLARLLRDHRIDVVVNCLGVLQDAPAATPPPCIAIRRAVLQAIRDATARSGWCISRFPARGQRPPDALQHHQAEAER